MGKNFLYEILGTFSKEEFKRFEDFLNSPYHNKKPTVVKFYKGLIKLYPDFLNKELNDEKLWEVIYKGKKYNYGVYKNIVFDVTALAEEFIELEYYKNCKEDKKINLLNASADRKLAGIFSSKFNSIFKSSLNKHTFSHDYYSDRIKLLKSLAKTNGHAGTVKYNLRELPFDLADNYTMYFFINLFDNYNEVLTEQTNVNYNRDFNVTESILKNINFEKLLEEYKNKNSDSYKVLALYYYMYKAITGEGGSVAYYHFKNMLIKNDNILSDDAKRKLYIALGNALSRTPSGTIENKINEYIQIYKKQIAENIFAEKDGTVNPVAYSNVIKMSVYVNDFKLIETVSKKFLNSLPDSIHNNMSDYTNAFLNYTKGNFAKALEYSSRIKLVHFTFKYDIKDLQAMIYYELNDYDSFLYLFDTYKHFLSKNKSVESNYKKWYLKFINYIDLLFKVRESGKKFDIAELRQMLTKDTFGTKFWFLNKLNVIEKRK